MARILVVDDEPAVRWVLSDLLRSMGHACEEAGDGIEALGRLRDPELDLVLCDVHMPRLGGLGLLEQIRPRLEEGLGLLLLTGSYDRAEADDAVARGACGWLVKPCEEVTLRAGVDLALATAAARRAGRRADLLRDRADPSPASPEPRPVPEEAPVPAAPVPVGARGLRGLLSRARGLVGPAR